MNANSNKGWTFRFLVNTGNAEPEDMRVVVLGEVGDVTKNSFMDEDALFYMGEDHAEAIAKDAIEEEFGVDRADMRWIETADYHPDHLVGLKQVDIGVWL